MRVDLPAPFCPTRAWTSPTPSERSTSCRTRPPGKSLEIPFIDRSTLLTRVSVVTNDDRPSVTGEATRLCSFIVTGLVLLNSVGLDRREVILGDHGVAGVVFRLRHRFMLPTGPIHRVFDRLVTLDVWI